MSVTVSDSGRDEASIVGRTLAVVRSQRWTPFDPATKGETVTATSTLFAPTGVPGQGSIVARMGSECQRDIIDDGGDLDVSVRGHEAAQQGDLWDAPVERSATSSRTMSDGDGERAGLHWPAVRWRY